MLQNEISKADCEIDNMNAVHAQELALVAQRD
jgi:hypothetical protein